MDLVYSEALGLPESELGVCQEMLRLVTQYQQERDCRDYTGAVKTCFSLLRLNTMEPRVKQSAIVGHLAVAFYNSGNLTEAARYAEMGLELSLGFHTVNHRLVLQTILNEAESQANKGAKV